MILGQIAYVDCLVFLVFLIPQLLLRVNVLELFEVALQALPFLCAWDNITARGPYGRQILTPLTGLQLPYQFLNEHLITKKTERSPFVQQATLFEDLVIRIVRYAFAKLPANIGIYHAIEALGSC